MGRKIRPARKSAQGGVRVEVKRPISYVLAWGVISLSWLRVDGNYDAGNGWIADEIKLSDVYFLGAHNSAMSKEHGWRYYQQNVSVREQWKTYGVRAFKVPLHYFNPNNTKRGKLKSFFTDKEEVYVSLAHEPDGRSNASMTRWQREFNAYPERAEDFFAEIGLLLETHSDDIVIMMLESHLAKGSNDNGMSGKEHLQREELERVLTRSGVLDQVFLLQEHGYDHDNWPQLGHLRKQNRRLILISNNSGDEVDHVKLYRENHFNLTQEEIEGLDFEKMRESRSEKEETEFFVLNHFQRISIPENSFVGWVLKYLPYSLTGGNKITTDYGYFNSYDLLMHHVNKGKEAIGMYSNIVLMDFVDQGANGGGQRVVFELNRMRVESTGE